MDNWSSLRFAGIEKKLKMAGATFLNLRFRDTTLAELILNQISNLKWEFQ